MNRRPVLAGLVLVTLGLVLLLDELGSVDARGLLATWWPLAVIASGLVQALVPPRSFGWGAVVVAIGSVLLLWRLDVVDDLSLLWPASLLALGGWLLLVPGRRRRTSVGREAGEEIDVVTIFSDRRVTLVDGPFAGGSVVTIFGDVDVDLAAGVVPGEAAIDGVTVFGDLDLVVPATWRVTSRGPTILGDVRIDDPVPVPGGVVPPELRLELVTIFGDVRVRRATVPSASSV